MTRAIDGLVNVDMGDREQPDWMVRVKEDYFKGGESFFKSPELSELLDDMDAHGVERAILMTQVGATEGRALSFVEARPDRFALAVGGFNLLKPMRTVRALESFVRDHPVAYAIVGPSFWGDGMYPPTDAVYYPLYTKCCELDLALCMNAGIPGPPLPAEPQNPIHLDRVCYRFPELKLCMIHGADPWWDTAIRLMLKYQQPSAHDLGVVAEATARVAVALHVDARQGPHPVRVGLPRALLRTVPRRGREPGPRRGRAPSLALDATSADDARTTSGERRRSPVGSSTSTLCRAGPSRRRSTVTLSTPDRSTRRLDPAGIPSLATIRYALRSRGRELPRDAW